MMRAWTMWLAGAALLAAAAPAAAVRVQDLAQLRGYGKSEIWGLGIVTGLDGAGDGGEVLPLARQIAAMMEEGGNPVPLLEELFENRNAAMVQVTATVPKEGIGAGAQLDVRVTAFHAAESLAGGRLFITPLRGPLPGQGVYAFASGDVVVDENNPTAGRVRNGATMAVDVDMQVVFEDGSIVLQLHPQYAGWPNAQMLTNVINQDVQGLTGGGVQVARALDAKSVRVAIPEADLPDPTNFIGRILSMRLDPTLLENPARIVVNQESGLIAISGDVTISPTVLAHRDLVITIVEPEPPPPTPENPRVRTEEWARLATGDADRARARLEDLVAALEQLDVPPTERVDIVVRLANAGLIHGELVLE